MDDQAKGKSMYPRLNKLVPPLLTLALGIVIGFALDRWMTPEPQRELETVVTPPVSAQDAGREMLRRSCTSTSAYASLTQGDRTTEKYLRLENLEAVAFSDRGIICSVGGTLYTTVRLSAGSAQKSETTVRQLILASITGESELVTEEFVKALRASPAVKGMASNVGNDGTVGPKPVISRIRIARD